MSTTSSITSNTLNLYPLERHPIQKEINDTISPPTQLSSSSEPSQPSVVCLPLPEKIKTLHEKTLFPLQRNIEKQYQSLPWPMHIKKILLYTEVAEGKGDIVAGGKVISLMQRICPDLVFDWVLEDAVENHSISELNPLSFLPIKSNVHPSALSNLKVRVGRRQSPGIDLSERGVVLTPIQPPF